MNNKLTLFRDLMKRVGNPYVETGSKVLEVGVGVTEDDVALEIRDDKPGGGFDSDDLESFYTLISKVKLNCYKLRQKTKEHEQSAENLGSMVATADKVKHANDEFVSIQNEAAAVIRETKDIFDRIKEMCNPETGLLEFRRVACWGQERKRWLNELKARGITSPPTSPQPVSPWKSKFDSGELSSAESELMLRRLQLLEEQSSGAMSEETFKQQMRLAEETFEECCQQPAPEVVVPVPQEVSTAVSAQMAAAQGWADAMQEYTETDSQIVKQLREQHGCCVYSTVVLLSIGLFGEDVGKIAF
eukprot:TRINITY_DN11007_c0_g1_i5.p1 TRINITY_DN11007_c0_g1~~TRINITY_DN11007_c0_g1_i5.p1  ORF type:complete len:302 (-),score=90.27 TRINITY_DN11007_c0_g1_i5:46-951(-)